MPVLVVRPRRTAVPWLALSPRQIGRTPALLWAIGAVLGACGCVLPHGPGVQLAGWWAISAMAAALAVASWWRGANIPIWQQYVQSVLACGAVTAAVVCAGSAATVYAVASLYVLTTVYTACFFGPGPFAAYLACQTAASGAVLLGSGQPAAPASWVVLMGTASTAGLVVHLLCRALAEVADADPLTGLPNRRAMERAVRRELARAGRRHDPLCLVVMDLDEFKEVNDQQGHAAGDRVLVEVAAGWASQLRAGAVLGRFGGDEFVALLPATAADDAVTVVERCRQVSRQPFSAGVAVAEPGTSFEDLMQQADAACYEAKRLRGGVVVAPVRTRP